MTAECISSLYIYSETIRSQIASAFIMKMSSVIMFIMGMATELGAGENSGWKKPQEVSHAASCSKQGQL